MAAGREHQGVVRQELAVIQAQALLAAFDCGYAATEAHRYLVVSEELLGANVETLALERAGQILLGERRALIRQPGFLPHDSHSSGVAPAAQRIRRLNGGLAAPGNDDLLV